MKFTDKLLKADKMVYTELKGTYDRALVECIQAKDGEKLKKITVKFAKLAWGYTEVAKNNKNK